MNAALQAIKATYNFFAGDVSILAGTSAAFALTFLLVRYAFAPTALVAVIFVALLAARLADCLNCDVAGPSRQRRRSSGEQCVVVERTDNGLIGPLPSRRERVIKVWQAKQSAAEDHSKGEMKECQDGQSAGSERSGEPRDDSAQKRLAPHRSVP